MTQRPRYFFRKCGKRQRIHEIVLRYSPLLKKTDQVENYSKVNMYAHFKLTKMDKEDWMRAVINIVDLYLIKRELVFACLGH